MLEDKIKTLEELERIVTDYKRIGKKIVLCHGCFDLLHYGHTQHFISSKKQGDILVVTVTPDEFVKKGPGRPFYNQEIRLKQIAALEAVNYVALNKWETAVETIELLKPDIYSKGKEVIGNGLVDEIVEGNVVKSNLAAEAECLSAIGGKLFLTDDQTLSSSRIINQITSEIPEETKTFLKEFRQKIKTEEILGALKSLEDLRVLIIGDSILDEYIYCKPMGMSGKETLIPYKFLESQLQLGGIFAVANNMADFTKNVSIVTCIGGESREFIISKMGKNIESNLFVKERVQTIKKIRYIDGYKQRKLFELYNREDLEIDEEIENGIIDYLEKNISKFDLVVVADFGHGMLSEKIINFLSDSHKFLAVNCQLNAGNMGYNFITKYKKADFVSLNDNEIRLPFQEKKSDIRVPIKKLSNQLNLNNINITLGKAGSIFYQNGEFFLSPSLTQNPLDTMGAGDAVFSLMSLLVYKRVNPQLVPFLGNCVGALAVKIMGNTKSIDQIELKKFVSYILK